MPSHAAFLRGVNLGGRRRVTNAELTAALEAAGFEQVGTFRASGNVVFTSPRRASDETLQRRVEEGLERALGYAVRTFVRSAQEVSAIATRRPFPAGAVRA